MKKFFRIYFLLCVMSFLFVKNVVSQQRMGRLEFVTKPGLVDITPSVKEHFSYFPGLFMNVSEAHGFNTRMYVIPAQLYPGSTLSLEGHQGMIDHGKLNSSGDEFTKFIAESGYYGPATDHTGCTPIHGGEQVKTPESKWHENLSINFAPWQMVNYSLSRKGKILSNQKNGFFWDDYVYCSYDQMGVKLKKEEVPVYVMYDFTAAFFDRSHTDIVEFERRGRHLGDRPTSFYQINNEGGKDWHQYASDHTCIGPEGMSLIKSLPSTFDKFNDLWCNRIAPCLYNKGKINTY